MLLTWAVAVGLAAAAAILRTVGTGSRSRVLCGRGAGCLGDLPCARSGLLPSDVIGGLDLNGVFQVLRERSKRAP